MMRGKKMSGTKLWKEILSIMLTIALITGLFPGTAATTQAAEKTVTLDLANGDIKIYPNHYEQGDSGNDFSGKYIITGSRTGDTLLQIYNDTGEKVTYDMEFKDTTIKANRWAAAVIVHGDSDIDWNIYNSGTSTISAHHHGAIRYGGTATLNVNIINIKDSVMNLERQDSSYSPRWYQAENGGSVNLYIDGQQYDEDGNKIGGQAITPEPWEFVTPEPVVPTPVPMHTDAPEYTDEPEQTYATAQPDNNDYGYIDADGKSKLARDCKVVDYSTTSLSTGWYVVKNNVTVDYRMEVSGDVNLILCDGAKLTAEEGIGVGDDNSLAIYGQREGTGTIEATGDNYVVVKAGIGGTGANCGTVTINGGTINATGGTYAAGIGGGVVDPSNKIGGTGGTITINGGTVKATGGDYAAGIGASIMADGGNITINGGKVTAEGGKNGAGIGGGIQGNSGTINIKGGAVTATGGMLAAGIGGGCQGNGNNITIDGGNVTAIGGSDPEHDSSGEIQKIDGGAGIGGGYMGSSDVITVNGGIVNANGGRAAAGIGSGMDGDSNIININDGIVTATGGVGSACIGSGYGIDKDVSGGTININGGRVTADGGKEALGIGDGLRKSGNNDKSAELNLGWTNSDTDSILVSKFNCSIVMKKLFMCEKDGAGYIIKTKDDALLIPGNRLYPCTDERQKRYDITGASVKGYDSFYMYTGNAINVAPTAIMSSISKKLECGRELAVSFTKDGEAVAEVKEPGEYKMTLQALYPYLSSVEVSFRVVKDTENVSSSTRTLENGKTYKVSGDVTINALLDVNGSAGLYLAPGSKLTVNRGIHVTTGNTLEISGSGELTATGYADGKNACNAGIGSGIHEDCGKIIINGGNITAKGGYTYHTEHLGKDGNGNEMVSDIYMGAAGIGGGYGGTGGDIIINGGTVTASAGGLNGSGGGAGIGGGSSSEFVQDENGHNRGANGGRLTINGGTVTAKASTWGAGIGGGYEGAGGTILINGGNVKAYGGKYGAGIGGSISNSAGTVYIKDGTVEAYAGDYAAGIGGGLGGKSGGILISGGKVTANGSFGGAGIGGGGGLYGTMSGELVDAKGGDLNNSIAVAGGEIIAKGGSYGYGIGPGKVYYLPGTALPSGNRDGEVTGSITVGWGYASFSLNATSVHESTRLGFLALKDSNPLVKATVENMAGQTVVPYHQIKVISPEQVGGTISSNVEDAIKGTVINLGLNLEEGWKFAGLTVVDQDGNNVPVNNFSFTMPENSVNIKPVFERTPISIANADITNPVLTHEYSGRTIIPMVTVKYLGEQLIKDCDYTIIYKKDGVITDNMTDAGDYTVIINGIGNYTGNVERTFTIAKAKSEVVTKPEAIENLVEDGTAKELIRGGTAENGTMKYAVTYDSENTIPDQAQYETAIPEKTAAGTYRVWYIAEGSANYRNTKPAYIVVTIAVKPSPSPSAEPSDSPAVSESPIESPSAEPGNTPDASADPGESPSAEPSDNPDTSATPIESPSAEPSNTPDASATPIESPSAEPSNTPDASAKPTSKPSAKPTASPSAKPTASPSAKPTASPSAKPTASPSAKPTASPSAKPTASPSAKPTASPSPEPTAIPTSIPMENQSPTTAPVIPSPAPDMSGKVTVTNPDGSTTTTQSGTDADGATKKVTETSRIDGSKDTTTEVTRPDGSTETTTEVTRSDGSTEKTVVKVASNGTTTKNTNIVDTDGTTVEEKVKITAKGKETLKKIETSKSGAKKVTEKTKQASGNYTATTTDTSVKKDKKGNITVDSVVITITKKTSNYKTDVYYEVVDASNRTVKLIDYVTNSKSTAVVIPKKITSDGKTYVVKELGSKIFKDNRKKLKSITIEASGITGIEYAAFDGIAKNARIIIKGSKKQCARIKKLINKSGIGKGVTIRYRIK